jgi:cytochrome c556
MIEKWNVDINKVKADLQKDIDELKTHLAELQPEVVDEIS